MKFRLVNIGPNRFTGPVEVSSLEELLAAVRKHLITQEAELDVMTCEMRVQDFKTCGQVVPLDEAACAFINAERQRVVDSIAASKRP